MSDSKRAKITDENRQEAARLKALWDDGRPHRTQAVFGEHYGLGNQANVGHYLNGRSALNAKAAAAFAAELGCAVADFSPRVADEIAKLQGGVAPISSAPPPRELPPPGVPGQDLGDFVAVRRADIRFSNGHGQVVYSEDDRPPLVFRADFLRRMGISQGNAVVVEAEGTSNEPKIPDGAVVLINRGDREHLNGDLFAFRVDGELLIKRLERIDGGGILATADNPNFKPKQKVYMNPPDFEVIGKAVWTGALL